MWKTSEKLSESFPLSMAHPDLPCKICQAVLRVSKAPPRVSEMLVESRFETSVRLFGGFLLLLQLVTLSAWFGL